MPKTKEPRVTSITISEEDQKHIDKIKNKIATKSTSQATRYAWRETAKIVDSEK